MMAGLLRNDRNWQNASCAVSVMYSVKDVLPLI